MESIYKWDHSHLSGVFATGLVLLFLPTMLVVANRSKRKGREYYTQLLAGRCGGVFPRAAWEFRSSWNLFGLPLVHVRVGDRFSILKPPVKAWVAIGERAIGGLFAFGGLAIAPLSIGGLSLGALSFGGVSIGIIGLGGITLGGWALFGGLAVGWQAFGCIAIAWSTAAGSIALAHDFAAQPNAFFRCAEFINHHWLWLNLFWMIPFLVQWLVLRRARKTREN
jgi:hypothetical protein